MNFEQYYKPPFKIWMSKVLTSDFNMAFDFPLTLMYPDAYDFGDDEKQVVVDVLNYDRTHLTMRYHAFPLIYKEGIIRTWHGRPFIIIRGWGGLTGKGGLNLDPEKAVELQDAFGRYLTQKLNNYAEISNTVQNTD